MALTTEILKKQEGLNGLTDEQLQLIATLSSNDETVQLKKNTDNTTANIYNSMDADLAKVTGQQKPAGVKTYDWFKQVVNESGAEEVKKLKGKVTSLEAENTRLKTEGAGADELKNDLKKARTELTQLTNRYESDKAAWQKKFDSQAEETENVQLNALLDGAQSQLTFREDLPEGVLPVMQQNARQAFLNTPREWVTTTEGKRTLVLKNPDGTTMADDKTLAAITPVQFLRKHLGGVIVQTTQQAGAGSGGGQDGAGGSGDGSGGGTAFALNGETTQVQAVANLNNHLKESGLTPGTDEHQEAFDAGFKDVIMPAELPIK